MDTRQLLGLLLVVAGALWLLFKGRRSAEQASDPSLNAGSSGFRNRSLPGLILLILGALLLVPWGNVFGSPAPCCPIGAQSGQIPFS